MKFSSATRLFYTESRNKIQFSISTQKPTTWNLKIALQGGSVENKEKWDESFSRARATRKKQGQRAPPPFPTRFSRTGGASVVVTASVSDLCTLLVMPCRRKRFTQLLTLIDIHFGWIRYLSNLFYLTRI